MVCLIYYEDPARIFRLIALPALLFLMSLAACPVFAQATPQAVSIAVGSNSHTYLLWNNSDGSASLWNLDASGSVVIAYSYGLY